MPRTGKISDLVGNPKPRLDWSWVRTSIRQMEPGDILSLDCPPGISISKFRSTVLVTGRRIHSSPEWVLCVRTEGQTVHCFLAPPRDFQFKP